MHKILQRLYYLDLFRKEKLSLRLCYGYYCYFTFLSVVGIILIQNYYNWLKKFKYFFLENASKVWKV